MINRINKGKTYEREIASFLSRVTESSWKRVPNSGGLATAKERDNTFQGDVYSHKHPNLIIECKHWKHLSLNDVFNRNSNFYKAVKQAKSESQGKDWLLFIKSNNQGTLMIREYMNLETEVIKKISYEEVNNTNKIVTDSLIMVKVHT